MKLKLVTLLSALCLAFVITFSVSTSAEASGDYHGHGHYHTVHYGETLWRIARAHGVTVHQILYHNPHIGNPNWVAAGTVIYVPATHYHPPHHHTYCSTYHHVYYGQTLSQIAHWYGVPMYKIAHANGIYNYNHIYAGQKLCIP